MNSLVTSTSAPLDTLLDKIETRTLTAGIVGLGYVGLPLAQLFTSQGFRVLGLDIDPAKTTKLMRGESYIGHIPASAIETMRAGDRLTAVRTSAPTSSWMGITTESTEITK